MLVGPEADRHLPAVLAAIGRTELAEDERFSDARSISRHRRAFISILDECFATRPLAEWAEIFARHDVWWGPVQTPAEVATDPQAAASGAWVKLAGGAGRSIDAPIRFGRRSRNTVADAPRLGQHNAEIAAELSIALTPDKNEEAP